MRVSLVSVTCRSRCLTIWATWVATQDTDDPTGFYQFIVPAGTYVVNFAAPEGTSLTEQDAPGVDDADDSDADPSTGDTAPVTLAEGENNPTIDAGLVSGEDVMKSIGDIADASANGNAQFNYVITVSNPSAIEKSPVTIVDPLPAWATYVSDDSGGGLNGAGDFEVTFPTIGR